jgi:molybdate/tungstate transport system substrate-binding protein
MLKTLIRRGCLPVCLGLALTVPLTALAAPSGKLIIFHAGSLSVPFAAMEKAFEAKYPGVDVLREAGGSTKMARMISEAGKPADIMASADYTVIDKTLIPGNAAVNIRFATNQLVLCYTDKSKYADEIDAKNWPEILQRKDVVWGHSEPNLDPCGYRSLMVLQLAEKFYNRPGLYEKLLANRPEANVRPRAVELITLLQNGDMDYAWEYRSVAVQHGLKFIPLDDHINLGNYALDDFYKQATVEVTGKEPGSFITRVGQSVTFGVTLINDAPNKEAAEAFLAYLLDAEGGLKILEEMGQPPFVPARVPTAEMRAKLPASIQTLTGVKE